MTYDEATRWLAGMGGRTIEAKEQIQGRGSIIVAIESRRRGRVQRHRLFDDRLRGPKRELAVHAAFLQACEELKKALTA